MNDASLKQLQDAGLTPHRKNDEIEKLRAFAIIFVLLWHNNDMGLGLLGITLSDYGTWTGVDLFFCISGYVITKSLFASMGAGRTRDYLLGFYVKRVFRIWPAALCCIGTALLVGFLSIKYVGPNLFNDAKNNAVPALLSYANFAFFFSKNHGGLFIGGFWSLSLEEQFYLIIPVALWWFRRRLPAFMILLFVLAFFQFVQHREPWKNLAWSVRTDGLMYGVIIAIIEYRYPAFFQNAGRRIASFRPVVTLLLLPALFILLGVIGAGYFRPYTQLPISWAGVIGACLVFIATLNQGLVFNRTLVSSVLVWIGSRSYGFYLFHNIVFVLFRVINLSAFHITFYVLSFNYYLLLLATLGCLCTLCELNYRLVEMPLRNLGRRIAAQHFSGAKAEVSLV